MTAQTVTDTNIEATVAAAGRPVLVDFWAPWCQPCRQLAPVVDDLARDHAEQLAVLKCNTDDNPAAAARYGVTSLPTLVVIAGGEVVKQLVGAQPRARLLRELAEWLA